MPAWTPKPIPPGAAPEVTRIFMNSIRTGSSLPDEDIRYIGQVVAQRTGLTQQDAEKGRKACVGLFISLLIGAFVASFAATIGGRQRDMQLLPMQPTYY